MTDKICMHCEFYRNGNCNRFPNPIKKGGFDFCGEWKDAKKPQVLMDSDYSKDSDYIDNFYGDIHD